MKEEINKTLAALNYDAFTIANRQKQTIGEKNDFYITLEQLNEISRTVCPRDCGFQEPYGFVAEEGCPIHEFPSKNKEP